MDRTVYANHLC